LLERELQHLEWLERQVQGLEQEIERRVASLEHPMRRLMTIPGIDRKTAWTLVAELGIDMSVFADAQHLASWAGLCPGNRESGGKRMSGRTRKANSYVRRAMCQSAWAASHTKGTWLHSFFRRIQVRKGAPKAVMALAHHLLVVVYNILKRNEEYVELGGDYYDQRNKPKLVSRLVERLTRLGYQVDLKPVESRPTELPSSVADTPSEQPQVLAAIANNTPAATEPTAPSRLKRGRPCKCVERGIICKHGRSKEPNSLKEQTHTGG